jgi:phenylalanyl-tRNA synthetase beta chain
MRLPLDWLEEWIPDLPDASVLAERLTFAGLEIEEITDAALPEKVLVGRIISAEQHPNADRLRVCAVDLGSEAPATIVCGAPNVTAGQFVAVATPGTRMPDGMKIKAGKLRGVRSEGMICSERELGLGEGHAGILTLEEGDFRGGVSLEAGRPLGEFLVPTIVFDIAITPNRGDCISVLGIARDVAALIGGQIAEPEVASSEALSGDALSVAIEAKDHCPWYCAQRFTVPQRKRSPLWMRRRLALAGVRSLSPVVDLTNYVMLERGQPTHAFDLSCLKGGRLVVRHATVGEKLRLLDDSEVELQGEDLVIADTEGPVALAGVMGGARSEVTEATREVVLESAVFDPRSVRRTARRLGIHSEASFRFEREVDPAAAATAVTAFAGHASGFGMQRTGPLAEAGTQAPERPVIALAAARVGQLLGTDVPAAESIAALRALGAQVQTGEGGRLDVVPPSWRNDLVQEADLIEEVARLRGFENIPTTRPRILARARARERGGLADLRAAWRSRGFAEALTLSFAETGENERFGGPWPAGSASVTMRNPLASVASELRRSLLPGLLGAAKLNRSRAAAFIPLFTSGRVFAAPQGGRGEERRCIAALVAGAPPVPVGEQSVPLSFLRWKGIVESVLEEAGAVQALWSPVEDCHILHPGQSAALRCGERVLGLAGALHPRIAEECGLGGGPVWVVELDLEAWREVRVGPAQFRSLARYPAIRRDLALVLDAALPAGEVLVALRAGGDSLVESVELFDQYTGRGVSEGKKSLGFAVSYRAADRTLKDEEVDVSQKRLLEHLACVYSFELR